MLASGLSVLALTAVVLFGIIGLGVVGGMIVSRVRLNRYMKVFNEDVKRPIVSQHVN